jgi:hypothetical protein
MTRLADRFTLYAPDLRGFGDSDKPRSTDQQAADMLALMDALGLAGRSRHHDVGGALRRWRGWRPSASPTFFDFVYPESETDGGAGRLNNIWYQLFTRWRWRPPSSRERESCRRYIGHFCSLVASRTPDDQFDAFTDNFQKRKPCRWLRALPRGPCRPGQDDEG